MHVCQAGTIIHISQVGKPTLWEVTQATQWAQHAHPQDSGLLATWQLPAIRPDQRLLRQVRKKTNKRLSLDNFLKVEIVTFFSFNPPLYFRPHLLFQFYKNHIIVLPTALAIPFFLTMSRPGSAHSYLPWLCQPVLSIHHTFLQNTYLSTTSIFNLSSNHPSTKMQCLLIAMNLSLPHGPIQLEFSQHIHYRLPYFTL